jgi:Domain of unknown function (DUF4360)
MLTWTEKKDCEGSLTRRRERAIKSAFPFDNQSVPVRMFQHKLLLQRIIVLVLSFTSMAWGRLSKSHDVVDQSSNTVLEGGDQTTTTMDFDHHDATTDQQQEEHEEQQQRALMSVVEPTWFGSGCPTAGSARVKIPAYDVGDRATMRVSFTDYEARTTNDNLRDYKSCNMALPLKIPANTQVGVVNVDYYGWAFVPGDNGADKPSARLDAEYFFSGSQGPTTSKTYGERTTDFNGKVHVADTVTVAWSPCGGDSGGATNFRINTSLTASKPEARDRNAYIRMDRAQVDGIEFAFQTRRC